jgi:hypothetical protein
MPKAVICVQCGEKCRAKKGGLCTRCRATHTCDIEGCEESWRLRGGLCPVHYNQKWRAARRVVSTKNCEACGARFETPIAHQTACSTKCRAELKNAWGRKHRQPRPGAYRVCKICHADFLAKSSSDRTCSEDCRSELRRRSARRSFETWAAKNRTPPPASATCKICDREYAPARSGQLTCSKKCRSKLAGLRRGDDRRRARFHGVEYEFIDRLQVYERDGWRCGICRKKVDKKLEWPHPMCATLDHIVPISQLGPHLYSNVQCAHWRCNNRKNARGHGDQLALIG